MIVDRSPEDEPLIPMEKTKIRLEIARKKVKAGTSSEKALSNGYPGGSVVLSIFDNLAECTSDQFANRQEMCNEEVFTEKTTKSLSASVLPAMEITKSSPENIIEPTNDGRMSAVVK